VEKPPKLASVLRFISCLHTMFSSFKKTGIEFRVDFYPLSIIVNQDRYCLLWKRPVLLLVTMLIN